ncbi:hypothetical protein [Psychrobacter sp. Pi2-1]|uniref:hypothetical protein n=1 Tax=Psychrobacter sp. Pi2-1 TaxID=2774131 RepID=UPI0019189481|nr:hypothetical protein [Psychrobacter sp. Pi2-1]
MSTKRHKLVLRYSSPVTMWLGTVVACFAWIMHISLLLTPLWDNNTHLGHGICAELAPIVSAAKQYEKIQADITQTNHNIPIDSAARHLPHHNAFLSLASPATVKPVVTVVAAPSQEVLYTEDKVRSSDPDSVKYNGCDFCTAISAALLPVAFTHTGSALIELSTVLVTLLYRSNAYYPSNFLQPLTRAPPQSILI